MGLKTYFCLRNAIFQIINILFGIWQPESRRTGVVTPPGD